MIDNGIAVNKHDFMYMVPVYLPYIGIGLLLTFPWVQSFFRKHQDNVLVTLIIFAMFWISVFSIANSSGNSFMYLRF